ncbi:MAG: regulatory protein RecX [Thiotrichales bacterium]|nr:regulatory protein RecX [Thiotrichales bacterium]
MLLAIREHGAKELKTKLISKFPETPELLTETQEPAGLVKSLIDDVIELCQSNNWQSDERYLEQAVRSMMDKGQGPMKIRQKCQQACQDSSLIDAYLDIEPQEWLAVARDVMMKKYGDLSRPANRNEQAKRMRFLQSRGFSSEVVWKVFR